MEKNGGKFNFMLEQELAPRHALMLKSSLSK